jgi:FkbH-like protein
MSNTKKCLIWDLDNTLWEGACLEGEVRLRSEAASTIAELDRRGILHSIASRSDADISIRQLKAFGLDQYFLAPKVNWLPKTTNIIAIGQELGISLDTMAFVDDEPFELEQVAAMLPDVMTIDARRVSDLPATEEFTPNAVTGEACKRRGFYQAEEARKAAEVIYSTRTEFLESCEMRLVVRPANQDDVPRATELATRTHQLNTTGVKLSPEKISRLVNGHEPDTEVYVADLSDRFGSYGTIGLSISQAAPGGWTLTYLALSCRVLGRGIERAFLVHLLEDARRRGFPTARALFRSTGRNRQMLILYHMSGFRSNETGGDETSVLELSLDALPTPPSWVTVS